MAYKIAFISYNERQTREYFSALAKANAEQVLHYDPRRGRIFLRDRTEIVRVSPTPEFLQGRRFDQVIVADDRRLNVVGLRLGELVALSRCMDHSVVPLEFRWCFFDLDEGVPSNEGL
jgi:hypothetical protein